jgi:hypothetical protein
LKQSTPPSQPQEQPAIVFSKAIEDVGDMPATPPQDADKAPALTIKPKKT